MLQSRNNQTPRNPGDERTLYPLSNQLAKTAPLLGQTTWTPLKKTQTVSPLLGHRAAAWAPLCSLSGIPSCAPEKDSASLVKDEKWIAISHIREDISKNDSYHAKKDIEDLTAGRIRISSILSRIQSRKPENANISVIGYQRRVISPRRNLPKSPQYNSDSLLPFLSFSSNAKSAKMSAESSNYGYLQYM